jgi:hypothetical protein
MIPTPQTYRDKLKPWCVIRHLPNMQRLTVARLRSRNDAEAYLQTLRQLMPTANHTVIFDATIMHTKE